jgi:hypothetical protein
MGVSPPVDPVFGETSVMDGGGRADGDGVDGDGADGDGAEGDREESPQPASPWAITRRTITPDILITPPDETNLIREYDNERTSEESQGIHRNLAGFVQAGATL